MTRNLPTQIRLLFCIAIAVVVSYQTALAQDHAAKIQEVLALASVTKQFTATAVLQLVEQGKIRLVGRLSYYLPEYRKDVGDKVTIHHLLTHTSGIPSYTGQPGFLENVSRNPYKVDEFVKKYASGDLEFEPGSKYSYNNSGYFLLGAIIEHATRKPYEQVLKENVFDPAGMKNTGYDHYGTILPKRASGYSKAPDGYSNALYLDMSIPYSAGSLYSTVEDLYLWDQALYTDKLLSAQSKALMYKPFLDNYAYGWVVTNASFKQNDQPVQMITHGGGINGFSTTIVRFPKEKNLIVMLDNTGSEYVDRLSDSIAQIIYNQPFEPPKISIVSVLDKTIAEKGIDAGIAQYRDLKARQSATYDFSENELNRLGYQLLRSGKAREAIEIFKLNVEAYPQGFNTYDSLAEAYTTINERELAIQNYKKSLELNPNNTNATEVLKRLEKAPVVVDTKLFDTYVGEYEVGPGFVMRIFREGDKFMTQATGQPQFEIFPESETTFYPRAFVAKLTFVKDADGKVTGIRIEQGGKVTLGKRIK